MEYRKLGRFNIENSVARGGMGEIRKSVDDSGRPIALKTILDEHLEDPKYRELFIREAEITFELDHPNIIKAYRFDQLGNQLVLALEFLDGVNLKEVLKDIHKRNLAMPLPIAVAIMSRVLQGLDYAHKKRDRFGRSLGIIHRDLNPSNVYLTYAGEVKILDFGISKATEKDVHQLTPNGELRGKMCYLSPEQIRDDRLDHRSDVFACGILLWEMLAGRPLYLRDTDAEAMEAITQGQYRSLRSIRPELPVVLDDLIRRALSVSKKSRFQSCAEMNAEMNRILKSHIVPSIGEEEIGIFVRALMNRHVNESDPHFLAGYAWLMTQIPGREEEGLTLLRRLAHENPQRPFVLLSYARAELTSGDRSVGLRMMRLLARSDSMSEEAQAMLEWLGVRRKPVLPFLKRSNPANFVLGKIRHRVFGPTPYQEAFLAA